MSADAWFAGVELGGTKTILVLACGDRIVEQVNVPTASPHETLPAARDQLRLWQAKQALAGVGIASFGPLQLQSNRPEFGHMLATPKEGWSGADIAGVLLDGVRCPARIDTDVNGAALAETRWGAGQGCQSLWYITVGTGVGGGLVIDGKPVHGAMHPEIGHIRVRRRSGDSFAGICPFHGDCIEGLVSGPALRSRFGTSAAQISDSDPRWDQVAADLGELVALLLLATSAERILFGGGVSSARAFLLPKIGAAAADRLAGYLPQAESGRAIDVVGPAGLGPIAGPLGAVALAQAAATG